MVSGKPENRKTRCLSRVKFSLHRFRFFNDSEAPFFPWPLRATLEQLLPNPVTVTFFHYRLGNPNLNLKTCDWNAGARAGRPTWRIIPGIGSG